MTIYLTARSIIEGWSASYSASVGTAIVASETVAEAWQYNAVSAATGRDGRVIVPSDHPAQGRWIRQNDYVAILAILAKNSTSADDLQTQTDGLSDAQQTIETGLQAISDAKAAADRIVSQASALLAQVSLADAATNQAAGRVIEQKTFDLSAAIKTASVQLAAKISEVETAYADAQEAIAQRTSTIEAELDGLPSSDGSVKAAIDDASTAYVNPLNAVSQRTSAIEAAYGSNSSSAIFKSGAIATASGAEASYAWSLTAAAGGQSKTAGQELDVVANGSILFSILRDISDYRTQEAGSYLFVWGDGFGVDGNLAYWFGPKMNIWKCSKTNAVEYRTVTGDAYFGGSLSAGILTTKAATSSTAADAMAETAVFGSNGGTITVTMSLAYSVYDLTNFPGTATGVSDFNAAVAQLGLVDDGKGFYEKSGTDAETYVDLYRAMAGGGYSLVATTTANGSYTYKGEAPISGEEPGYILLTETISGSLTYTDPDKSTSNRQYKAVIRTRSAVGTAGISQTLTVICVEE